MVFVQTACSGTAATPVNQSAQTSALTEVVTITATSILNASYNDAVSVEEPLILGTFNLDGTARQGTKDQAAALLLPYTSLPALLQQRWLKPKRCEQQRFSKHAVYSTFWHNPELKQ